MNVTGETPLAELLEQVAALDQSGGRNSTMFFQRFNLGGTEFTVAVGTAEGGRMLERVVTGILARKGVKPDPRSFDAGD